MTVSHKDLPNAQLHEPKGISAASVDTTYVANGTGSGVWRSAPYTYSVSVDLTDISTNSTAYVVAPVAGKITRIDVVLQAGITVADSNLSFELGGVAIAGSAIPVGYAGSAAGSVFHSLPSADNTVSAGQAIKATSDGASSTTARATITYKIQVGYT